MCCRVISFLYYYYTAEVGGVCLRRIIMESYYDRILHSLKTRERNVPCPPYPPHRNEGWARCTGQHVSGAESGTLCHRGVGVHPQHGGVFHVSCETQHVRELRPLRRPERRGGTRKLQCNGKAKCVSSDTINVIVSLWLLRRHGVRALRGLRPRKTTF